MGGQSLVATMFGQVEHELVMAGGEGVEDMLSVAAVEAGSGRCSGWTR
jgi:hypothetical protein